MNNVRNATILDLQTINHLCNLILIYTQEPPTEKLLRQIKGLANRIEKVTQEYVK